MTRLLRATTRHRGGIEEKHDRTLFEEGIERARCSLLIEEREIWNEVAFVHDLRLRVKTKSHAADGDEMARILGVILNLLAKSFDVRVERARVGELESPPQRVETHFSSDDLTETRGEERQKVKFLTT